ncbi:hypothetical protein K402DRAFT_450813 [Aulographum hederae CBS 113979]|uniref:SH3 domain-containing protein n=1 Tax=Aulographum hederae CBS 113979 TaxID=1176131 RepID=A0A6G1HD83_9PEZI|nr:hypothetical protein K402DRAFT_450813 [Aulographum hederae CBS 113979]
MAPAAPDLPQRFPCWCRAVYSWGGEEKKDLGFIEGDLIECLNAGDGSWWMGRLKRDKRAVGLFPSNFVELLPEDYAPASRAPSPLLPEKGGGNISRAASPNPPPQKSKSAFRKPFQAYSAPRSPNPEAAARERMQKSGSLLQNPHGSVSKHRPYSAMKRSSNERSSGESIESPSIPQPAQFSKFRAISPAPRSSNTNLRTHYSMTSPRPASQLRSHSPNPIHQYSMDSRAASPVPPNDPWNRNSRAPSPNPDFDMGDSPPPPAPPPHRVAYNPSRAPSPQPMHQDAGYYSRDLTPEPRSAVSDDPTRTGLTPSPLTHAMNDVMSSLHDMGLSGRSPTPEQPATPPHVWSPDAYDEMYSATVVRKHRANTALGINSHQDSGYGTEEIADDSFGLQDTGGPGDSYVQKMERRLREMQQQQLQQEHSDIDRGPVPPRKDSPFQLKSQGSQNNAFAQRQGSHKTLKNRKSAYELGKQVLGRTFTTKTNATQQSSSTEASNQTSSTNHTLMSGASAGQISATSAGSMYRHRWKLNSGKDGSSRPFSVAEIREKASSRLGFGPSRPGSPQTGLSGPSYHSSHASVSRADTSQGDYADASGGLLGGLSAPSSPKKRGLLKRFVDNAKAGAATARSTVSSQGFYASSRPASRMQQNNRTMVPDGITAIAGGLAVPNQTGSTNSAARDMGLGGGSDWVQVRRDVNRSNSLSKNERDERMERCHMNDLPVINPVDVLWQNTEGDEGLDGLPVSEPTDFIGLCNLALVDKSARFVSNLPPLTTPASLAQSYVCRPYRSDVQRLRAIFTWVSERITWEEDFEGEIDSRRTIETLRACSEEIAVLVSEMCAAVGIHSEIVRGHLKLPSELLDIGMDLDAAARPNHWWNSVIIDGEWRVMDCGLSNPTHPQRAQYSSAGPSVAESWWFLARPSEICYTHIPLLPEQQHLVPALPHDVLMALPIASPPYFKNQLAMAGYDTSLLQLENLEMAHIKFETPEDVEAIAEVEVKSFQRDADGDYFESGETVTKPALCQAEWYGGRKRWVVKGVLPGDEGRGLLKVYAGKRGLMHSASKNPHPLAIILPLTHAGQNPPFDFLTRHPTPHASRNDIYCIQPQCARLVVNNTFVFSVRQHPNTLNASPSVGTGSFAVSVGPGATGRTSRAGAASPMMQRPGSAMSVSSNMVSATGSNYSGSGSNPSTSSTGGMGMGAKPAKLAVQSPSGKIIRLTRKSEVTATSSGREEEADGTVWETIIKVSERGGWRGLVLADRSAKWCVWAEWVCV